ncbi:hypothetical protein ASPCAL08860 [Aspergillus calidoustus]|uniref:Uncharacterized protein n=1 Tax=Aspergillus calidoustus TaxID=454130 RepID=A0A0U5CR56_ASPCI|nr:hypothetical protein ASPCAL08860 [Aspergillus calidoustus]
MQYPSKIAIAAVAFASAIGVVTAAPAIGFNNTGFDNETFVIQPYMTCIQDSQCGFGSFCDTPAGRCTLGCRADFHCAHDHRCQDDVAGSKLSLGRSFVSR